LNPLEREKLCDEGQEGVRENCTDVQGQRREFFRSCTSDKRLASGSGPGNGCCDGPSSKSYVRAEGDAEIVLGAASEIDFVANIETQTDGTDAAFETTARIENSGEVMRAKIGDGTYGVADCGGSIIQEEMSEATFDGDEGMKMRPAESEFGTDEAVKNTHIGTLQGDGWRHGGIRGKTFGKYAIEVIVHFCFEGERPIELEAEASADAGEIGIGFGEVKIVGVYAGLDMVILGE
jgi:hypothetical protein